jgi:protein-disulfide isomerase
MQQQLAIPLSIIAAGALIAGALYFSNKNNVAMPGPNDTEPQAAINAPKVSTNDWIRGNPDATIKIVEYSDPQCGYCKRFHPTMQRIMNEYGKDGKVAWIYRQLPILGPESFTQALSLECVGKLKGQAAFWTNLDEHFTGPGGEPNLAKLGIDKKSYDACMANPTHIAELETAAATAQSLGIQGTPHSIVMVGEEQVSIDGAQPYESVKAMLDGLIK